MKYERSNWILNEAIVCIEPRLAAVISNDWSWIAENSESFLDKIRTGKKLSQAFRKRISGNRADDRTRMDDGEVYSPACCKHHRNKSNQNSNDSCCYNPDE